MSTNGYWVIALLLGLVVAVVTVVLLQMFYREVRRIEAAAGEIWQAGKQVASNTSATWLLQETSQRLDGVHAEAQRHKALLRGNGTPGGAR